MDDYERRFKPTRVVDGDTITTDLVDLGYHCASFTDIRYRLLRVDCPESNRPESRVAGLAAKEFTKGWLAEHITHDPGGWLWARTVKTDSFGRYLAEVTCTAGHNLSDALLAGGHAVPFKG